MGIVGEFLLIRESAASGKVCASGVKNNYFTFAKSKPANVNGH